jgi:hypothetical protein
VHTRPSFSTTGNVIQNMTRGITQHHIAHHTFPAKMANSIKHFPHKRPSLSRDDFNLFACPLRYLSFRPSTSLIHAKPTRGRPCP